MISVGYGARAWVVVCLAVAGCDPGPGGDAIVPRHAAAHVELETADLRPESDERPHRTARLMTPLGVEALGPVLEVAISPDAQTIAVLDDAHVLRIHDEPRRGTLDAVEPGVRVCDDGRVVLARVRDAEALPPARELVLWDPDSTAVPLRGWGDGLDRVLAVSPDCSHAVVVAAEGLPVVIAVELPDVSKTATVRGMALANRHLPRTPGQRPPGFVPVPDLDAPVTWTDARTLHWTVLGEAVTLTIPGGAR